MKRRVFIQKTLLISSGLFFLDNSSNGNNFQSKKKQAVNEKKNVKNHSGMFAHSLNDKFYELSTQQTL